MKKNMLKVIAIVLSVVMLTVFAGCSSKTNKENISNTEDQNSDKEKKTVTLVVMGNQEDINRDYMQKAFANYEAKTGNKLDLQGLPSDSSEQVALTKFNTGDIPDIFMHFGGYQLKAFNPEKNFVDFSDATWVDDILPTVKNQAIYNGKVYGLPHWEASMSGIIYNKEIFKKLGIDIPKTQEEFNDACDKIKDAGITPIYLAFKDAWPLLFQFSVDTMVEDTEILEKLNRNQIKYADIPEFRKMVEWYKMIADEGYIGDKFTTNTWDYAVDALGKEEAAMMICWDTWIAEIDKKYPGTSSKMGLMPAFLGTPNEGTFEGPNVSLLLANKNSKNVDAAIEFVNFMATPENYNYAFEGFQTAPVFKGQETHVATPQYIEAKKIIEEVGRPSIAWANIIGFSGIDGAKYLQELMIGNITIDECIKGMDDERINIAKSQGIEGFDN